MASPGPHELRRATMTRSVLVSVEPREDPEMTIVLAFDLHREQLTYDLLDQTSGEIRRGRVAPGDRDGVRRFLTPLAGVELDVAVEATTGWRFVAEEVARVGGGTPPPEPTETRNLRGRKRRAKTDRTDARHLRQLLVDERLPEAW